MNDLTKRVQALESRLHPKSDPEWWLNTKLGLLWLSLGIILGSVLEQFLYGLDRLELPQYLPTRKALINDYVRFIYGIPTLALILATFIFFDYLRRRTVNKRQRTPTSKTSRFLFYVLMLAGGFVGYILLAESIELALWRKLKGVI